VTTPVDLPPLNPFPVQATTAIEEGSFVESYRPWARATPTLTVEPIRQLTALARRFRATAADGRSAGQAAFVYGPHGAGKTHAIRAGVGQVATEDDDPALLPLYVKLSSPNVVNAYRRLMSQLTLAELTDLALRFLGSLTDAAGPSLAGSVEERLRVDPAALLTMFSEHVLERGLLLQAQADRLRAVVTGEQDFQRALTYLLEPDLKDAAYSWLQGRPLGDQEMRRLGLSGHLDTPDQCRYGLQLLTLICARAERPLVLILDQAEKFLAQPDGSVVADSMGFLHSLVEAVPDLGGMLVVAANDETWAMLPADLRQRFGANDIACAGMQPGQAFELLGLYIMAAYRGEPPPGYRAPQPFTEPAVHELLRRSGGNLRSLLQLAWQSFDRLQPGAREIGVEQVPDEQQHYDRTTVEASVRRAVWRLGRPSRDPKPGFAYGLTVPGTGRLLIRVSEAMFYRDEADRAAEDVRVLAATPDDGEQAQLDLHVLIVIGYASSEVLHLLGQVYDEVLVYRDDDTLAAHLAAVVDPAGPPRIDPTTADDYRQAQDRLEQVGWSREEVSAGLSGDVAALGRRDEAERAARRYDELLTRWPEARGQIAQRITAARRERAETDLDELYRVGADHLRRRNLVAGAAVAALLLLIGGVLLALTLAGSSSNSATPLLTAVALIAVLIVFGFQAILRWKPSRPTSQSEADRMARDKVRASGMDDGTRNLHSADPYRRYGALLVGMRGITTLELREALRVERVRIVRRAIAGRLGALLSESRGPLAETAHDADRTDLPYLVAPVRSPRWDDVAKLPPPIRALVALVNGYGRDIRAGRRRSAADPAIGSDVPAAGDWAEGETDEAVRLVVATAAGDGEVGAAYRKGLSFDRLLRALDESGDRELRRAAALLSPFDGVGAADHLPIVDELERLYLFIEQLIHFRDGGLSPASPLR
jgi:hypothetical protein